MTDNKLIGSFLILFGIIIFFSIFWRGPNDLVFQDSDALIIKYGLLIIFVNGGITFVAMGFLIFINFITPYRSKLVTNHEKAKNQVFFIASLLPMWVISTIYVFFKMEKISIQILWSVLMIYIVCEFFHGLNVLIIARKK